MDYVIRGREPKRVLELFEEICAIPHGSGNEAAIATFVCDFAASRGLSFYRDELDNLLVKKAGCGKKADSEPVMLQGHLDMVCEKNSDTPHDFLTDGIKVVLGEDGWLRAKGTTLGGDDGIAVAMMLALLEGEGTSDCPPLECLFTTGEETGLFGASGFDYSHVSARKLINLDSEEEDQITCGCAGGVRSELIFGGDGATEKCDGQSVEILLRGLSGGHSGADIHTGRANANKLMGRVLAELYRKVKFNIVSIDGGSKDNAIPRECRAVIATKSASASIAAATEILFKISDEICTENSVDKDFSFVCKKAQASETAFNRDITERVIATLASVQNGVLEMSRNVDGLVEFSRNLGIIKTENGRIALSFSSRSAIDSQLDASLAEIDAIARVNGCEVSHHSRYPGWAFKENSPVRDTYAAVYERIYGKKLNVSVIHAGLECGIISGKIPEMDMISVGPDMHAIHSPDEALSLESVEHVWKVLLGVLAEI